MQRIAGGSLLHLTQQRLFESEDHRFKLGMADYCTQSHAPSVWWPTDRASQIRRPRWAARYGFPFDRAHIALDLRTANRASNTASASFRVFLHRRSTSPLVVGHR